MFSKFVSFFLLPFIWVLLFFLQPANFNSIIDEWASLWEKQSSGFQIRSDSYRAVQPQKIARGLKFWIYKEEGLYNLCSENKGADQLRSYYKAQMKTLHQTTCKAWQNANKPMQFSSVEPHFCMAKLGLQGYTLFPYFNSKT